MGAGDKGEPDESSAPPARASDPKEVAAGLTALRVTYQHARRQTGVLRALRVLSRVNQKSGFDCPGCAWPDPENRSVAEFCENGAKAVLDEATTRRVDTAFFAANSAKRLQAKSDQWLNAQGRITEPFILRPGASHFEPISYEDALEQVASELAALDSPDQAAFYASGRASNEAAFLYQLLARRLGTNNLPDCSNLCHESSGLALKESLGIGKGTVRLSDFNEAELILVIGQNPGTNHPRMLSALLEARAHGASVVSINPLIETGLRKFAHPQKPVDLLEGGKKIADRFVRVAIGGDQALFRGLCKVLLHGEQQGIDRSFITEFTEGFSDFTQLVRSTSWSEIEKLSGVSQLEITELAEQAREAKGIICCWAMGITQHVHAVATIQEVVNFLLLGGHMGRPGAGACPVRGHSNVQGDRSVGIACGLPEHRHAALEAAFSFRSPRERGLDTVGTIQAMLAGKVSHFVSLGGNFLSASPDTELTTRALEQCRLSVQVATKLNRSHLHTGGTLLLLPCLGRTEQDTSGGKEQVVSVENSMGVVSRSRGRLSPPSRLWSEPRIVSELGKRLEAQHPKSAQSQIPWAHFAGDYAAIRAAIERTVPGFDDYNSRLKEGFELPNGPRERRFTNAQGKALFRCHELFRLQPEGEELILTTVRTHDQFNTTIYSETDRYRGIEGRRVVLVHPEDLRQRGLCSGDVVEVESRHRHSDGRQETRQVRDFRVLPYDVPRGSAVSYFPEANPLIFLSSMAERSRTPTSKAVRVALRAQQATS